MPSAYTSKIYNGENVSFKEFALTFARNYGSLIHMREESLGAKLRYPEVSDYHLNRIKELEKELQNIETIKINKDEKYKKSMEEYNIATEKRLKLKKRYEEMLEKVLLWTPPTLLHDNLKNGMISQLQKSIEFDCYIPSKPIKDDRSEEEIRNEIKKGILKDIEYHKNKHEEEVLRIKQATQWIKELEKSLEKEMI